MSTINELRELVRDVDPNIQRFFPFSVESVRASGNPDKKGIYYVRGIAAVFDAWSLDLGGFREKIRPGAFDNVLARDPHVLHLWDHDTARTLSSTRNKTLKLSVRNEVPDAGLHYDSEVAPTSYAADLRILLERGDIDQSSFAFTVEQDEWRIAEDGEIVEREIIEVRDLYDVTTCAMGAYPQTEADLALRTLLKPKVSVSIPGAVPLTADLRRDESKEVAPATPAGTPRASNEDATDTRAAVARLKREAEIATSDARDRLYRRREQSS
jgi:HK97 family phage prohead protease